jgi:hypothetical protein
MPRLPSLEDSPLTRSVTSTRTLWCVFACLYVQIHFYGCNSHYLTINLYLKFSQPSRIRRANGTAGSPGNRATRRKSRGGTKRSGPKVSSENSVTSSRNSDVWMRMFPWASRKLERWAFVTSSDGADAVCHTIGTADSRTDDPEPQRKQDKNYARL